MHIHLRPCREGHRSFPFQRRQRHPVLFECGVCWTGDRPPFFVQFRSTHRTQRWALFVFACVCSFVRLFVGLFVCIIFAWWLPYLEALVGDVVADPLSALLIDVCLVAQEPSPTLRVTQFMTGKTSVEVRHKMWSCGHPHVFFSALCIFFAGWLNKFGALPHNNSSYAFRACFLRAVTILQFGWVLKMKNCTLRRSACDLTRHSLWRANGT